MKEWLMQFLFHQRFTHFDVLCWCILIVLVDTFGIFSFVSLFWLIISPFISVIFEREYNNKPVE